MEDNHIKKGSSQKDTTLNAYIHEYLIKQGFVSTANTFRSEALLNPKDIPFSENSLLWGWWSIFWDVYSTRQSKKRSSLTESTSNLLHNTTVSSPESFSTSNVDTKPFPDFDGHYGFPVLPEGEKAEDPATVQKQNNPLSKTWFANIDKNSDMQIEQELNQENQFRGGKPTDNFEDKSKDKKNIDPQSFMLPQNPKIQQGQGQSAFPNKGWQNNKLYPSVPEQRVHQMIQLAQSAEYTLHNTNGNKVKVETVDGQDFKNVQRKLKSASNEDNLLDPSSVSMTSGANRERRKRTSRSHPYLCSELEELDLENFRRQATRVIQKEGQIEYVPALHRQPPPKSNENYNYMPLKQEHTQKHPPQHKKIESVSDSVLALQHPYSSPGLNTNLSLSNNSTPTGSHHESGSGSMSLLDHSHHPLLLKPEVPPPPPHDGFDLSRRGMAHMQYLHRSGFPGHHLKKHENPYFPSQPTEPGMETHVAPELIKDLPDPSGSDDMQNHQSLQHTQQQQQNVQDGYLASGVPGSFGGPLQASVGNSSTITSSDSQSSSPSIIGATQPTSIGPSSGNGVGGVQIPGHPHNHPHHLQGLGQGQGQSQGSQGQGQNQGQSQVQGPPHGPNHPHGLGHAHPHALSQPQGPPHMHGNKSGSASNMIFSSGPPPSNLPPHGSFHNSHQNQSFMSHHQQQLQPQSLPPHQHQQQPQQGPTGGGGHIHAGPHPSGGHNIHSSQHGPPQGPLSSQPFMHHQQHPNSQHHHQQHPQQHPQHSHHQQQQKQQQQQHHQQHPHHQQRGGGPGPVPGGVVVLGADQIAHGRSGNHPFGMGPGTGPFGQHNGPIQQKMSHLSSRGFGHGPPQVSSPHGHGHPHAHHQGPLTHGPHSMQVAPQNMSSHVLPHNIQPQSQNSHLPPHLLHHSLPPSAIPPPSSHLPSPHNNQFHPQFFGQPNSSGNLEDEIMALDLQEFLGFGFSDTNLEEMNGEGDKDKSSNRQTEFSADSTLSTSNLNGHLTGPPSPNSSDPESEINITQFLVPMEHRFKTSQPYTVEPTSTS
eukprot:TRINITY_DN380_c0_g3_i1.p1 TRINITY_DN380_c0_g3~~TRINITY_DN380_c0_g3_i1.p1  ORF type:complete len:1046 (+),score=208.54 TRINITY_DN380_c0_g3_i1:32-3139(+)